MSSVAFSRQMQFARARHWLAATIFALTAMIGSSAAAVYYSATLLSTPGFNGGEAYDTTGATNQVGYGKIGVGESRALMWDGTSANPVSLHPAGYYSSVLIGSSGANQAGSAVTSGPTYVKHAMLWGTTAASAVDLHPASGYSSSEATAVYGTTQVGYGQVPGGSHALLWSGTAASKVDLHPTSGFTSSTAVDVYGTKQVGYAKNTSGADHAMLWTGTAASRVDLNPSGYSNSQAWGIYATGPTMWKQVGYAELTGVAGHAMLWTSTAASKVDLHPDSSFKFADSIAYGGSLAGQVGYGTYNGPVSVEYHAAYWNGTAASCVDLNKYLGGLGNFKGSQAYAIADDGTIIGYAYVGSTPNITNYPVMWKPVTESGVPGDYNNNGKVDAGDYVVWRKYNGTNYVLMNEVVSTTPGSVTQEDLAAWSARFGNTAGSGSGATANVAVPEPATFLMLILAMTGWSLGRCRVVH